jgi:hypothetical protein
VARRGWGRRVWPVCSALRRDVATGICASAVGSVPILLAAALLPSRTGVGATAAALLFSWGAVLGLAVNALRSRCGQPLIRVVAVVTFLAGLAHAVLARAVDAPVPTGAWHAGLHAAWGLGLLAFPLCYRAMWGVRPRNCFPRRRWDPYDPLGA